MDPGKNVLMEVGMLLLTQVKDERGSWGTWTLSRCVVVKSSTAISKQVGRYKMYVPAGKYGNRYQVTCSYS
jgi:hypothetical protein